MHTSNQILRNKYYLVSRVVFVFTGPGHESDGEEEAFAQICHVKTYPSLETRTGKKQTFKKSKKRRATGQSSSTKARAKRKKKAVSKISTFRRRLHEFTQFIESHDNVSFVLTECVYYHAYMQACNYFIHLLMCVHSCLYECGCVCVYECMCVCVCVCLFTIVEMNVHLMYVYV